MEDNKKIRLMREGKIPTTLLRFGLPAAIGMLTNALYGVCDSIFIGQLGTSQLGSISVVLPIILFFVGFSLLFGTGAASYISRLLGEGRFHRANETGTSVFLVSMLLTLIVSLLMLLFLDSILLFLGATPEVFPYAKMYGTVFIGGAVFHVGCITLANIARSEGALMISMMAMLVGVVLNLILDPLLIFTAGFGVQGAAIATVISQLVAFIFIASYFVSGKNVLVLKPSFFSLDRSIFGEVFKVGSTAFISQLLVGISLVLLNNAAVSFGESAIAAIGVVYRVSIVGIFVIYGFTRGLQPVAGYNYGAGLFARVRYAMNFSFKFTFGFGLFYGVVLFFFSPEIASLFSSNAQTLEIVTRLLRTSSIIFPLFAIQSIVSTVFLSMGKARLGAIISLARSGTFFVPLVVAMPLMFGIDGLVWIQSVADIFAFLLTLILIKKAYSSLPIA